jgi:hypothetical protein
MSLKITDATGEIVGVLEDEDSAPKMTVQCLCSEFETVESCDCNKEQSEEKGEE